MRVFLVCSPTFFKIEGPGIASHFSELHLPSGVCIRDFSRDELFNDRILFNDPGHLNHNGAVIFSRLVASEMKAVMKSN